MRRLQFLPLVFLVLGCKSGATAPAQRFEPPVVVDVSALPLLGTAPEAAPQFWGALATGPSNLEPAYRVRFAGALFDVTVDREGRVFFVSTADAGFSTPDGVHAGGSFTDAVALAGTEVAREPGWLCHVALPSGWHAAARLEGRRGDRCSWEVVSVFQRRDDGALANSSLP